MAQSLVLGLQWVVFHAGIVISGPVILAKGLSLTPSQTTNLMQITFVVTGLGSIFQVLVGHRKMLVEGPAVPWWVAYLALATVALPVGIAIEVVRTNIEGAMIVGGAVVVSAGFAGIIRRLRFLFTHRITGVLLTLIAIQTSSVAIRGLVGHGLVPFVIGVLVLLTAVVLLTRTRGLVRNSAILVSVAVGWGAMALLGVAPVELTKAAVVDLPAILPWGRPTFEFGSIFTLTLLGLLLIPNQVGSIKAMEQVAGKETAPRDYDRGLATTGLVCTAAGLFGGIGTAPFAISAGLVSVTRERTNGGFLIGGILFVVLGVVPVLGELFSAIPVSIASAVLLISVSSLAMIGLESATQAVLDVRASFVIGLGLLVGTGIMFLPSTVWSGIPGWLSSVLSNGVITGTITAIVLEQSVLRSGRSSDPA